MTDKARQLYEDGLAAIQKSKWLEARASLLAAWSLAKHWQIAANLAGCELELGKFREAAEHARFYLQNAPADRRAKAELLLERAKPKIGVITVDAEPAGADVHLDGVLVGQAPLRDPLYVDPGEHVLLVRASGRPDVTQRVSVIGGQSKTIPLKVEEVRTPPTPQPTPRSVVPGAVLGSVAGATLITGAVLLGVGAAKRGDARTTSDAIQAAHHSCVAGAGNFDARCSQLDSTARTADRLHDAGVGLLVVAGAAAAGTAAYFLWPSSAPSRPSAFHVTPIVSTTGAGLHLSGAF
ncbi:Dihydrolipoamide acetyltransferase [Minicystis rosea]|nr:Dihydrolipoamide acetyltransferase [Minicystis rosea]